ncbi:MAG: hypothetical protein AAFQ94_09225 [Bacteroidota bacterium]
MLNGSDPRNHVVWLETEQFEIDFTGSYPDSIIQIGGGAPEASRWVLDFGRKAFRMYEMTYKMYYQIVDAPIQSNNTPSNIGEDYQNSWILLPDGNCFIYDEPVPADAANYPTVTAPDTFNSNVFPAVKQQILHHGVNPITFYGFGKVYLNPRISTAEILLHMSEKFSVAGLPLKSAEIKLGVSFSGTFEYTI